jgi:glutamyl-Q tRNA(Asp) synthetase
LTYLTRFAPSPTGPLHLGHAFSALTAWDRARVAGGTFLLRIEDLDPARCRPDYEAAIYDDLGWLGLDWPRPVWRQSGRLAAYQAALDRLAGLGLTYPCACTRRDIAAALAAPQEGAAGPDGPVYPGTCRGRPMATAGPGEAIRLDLAAALDRLGWPAARFAETGPGRAGDIRLPAADLLAATGDIVIGRKDTGSAAYHLAVVVDDAAQGVTEVVRGEDLFAATGVQRVLQGLLGLPEPAYHHHRLIRDAEGKRLAKRDDARALAVYRAEGVTPAGLRSLLGL